MAIQGHLELLEQYQVIASLNIATGFAGFLHLWLLNILWICFRPGVKNAVQIAALLVKEQMMGPSLLGLIPPM